MSMLVCPLCCKSTSLAGFDPSGFDIDIVVQTVRGLGRGRGFEVVSRESVLGDDVVTPLVADRVLDIISMLLRKGYLKAEEVVSRLKIEAIEPDYERVEEDEREKESEVSEGGLEDLKEQLDGVYEEIRGMIDLIEDTLNGAAKSDEEWIWRVDKGEDAIGALGERLTDLLDEYESLAAETE